VENDGGRLRQDDVTMGHDDLKTVTGQNHEFSQKQITPGIHFDLRNLILKINNSVFAGEILLAHTSPFGS
jgi:hypothetical protein